MEKCGFIRAECLLYDASVLCVLRCRHCTMMQPALHVLCYAACSAGMILYLIADKSDVITTMLITMDIVFTVLDMP